MFSIRKTNLVKGRVEVKLVDRCFLYGRLTWLKVGLRLHLYTGVFYMVDLPG